jgi:predicted TIM-barrel fold metal-dependent hydrolase
MLDGTLLVDAHVHAARIPTLKVQRSQWALQKRVDVDLATLYDDEGTLVPERFDAFLEEEGVDCALLLAEYSPRVTGIQSIEDLLPLVRQNPRRLRCIANVNPHVHYPVLDELERQLDLGAVALKLHPVHGNFPANARELYPAYAACRERGVPIVVHCGTSFFPGATNRFADPAYLEDVVRDFPELTVLLAHGGRGWWYDAAAFMTQLHENVWIEISGLPPHRLPDYFNRFDLERLAEKWVFGTDWPGSPGIRANAQAVADLGLRAETLVRVLGGNAIKLYRLDWLAARD